MEFESPNIIGWVLFSIVIILLIVSWVKEEIDMRKWRKKDFQGRSGEEWRARDSTSLKKR